MTICPKQFFEQHAYYIEEAFLNGGACASLLSEIKQKQAEQVLPHVKRAMQGRNLDYRVMDGLFIEKHLPMLIGLAPMIRRMVNKLCGSEIYPISNLAAAVNVNITPLGGEYRWHYDRNSITAILYLNQVQRGETELIPNSRFHLGPLKHSCIQRWVDLRLIRQLKGNQVVPGVVRVTPMPGKLLVMQGDRCLHSVAAVESDIQRYNLIYTFDKKGARFPTDKNLDPYLYSMDKMSAFDPNYSA